MLVWGRLSQVYLQFLLSKKNKIYHPTIKNVEFLEWLLQISSKENDLVLDPFMGSGSTGVACINTNRNFIGIELDENYFNIAEERIHKAIKDKEPQTN